MGVAHEVLVCLVHLHDRYDVIRMLLVLFVVVWTDSSVCLSAPVPEAELKSTRQRGSAPFPTERR